MPRFALASCLCLAGLAVLGLTAYALQYRVQVIPIVTLSPSALDELPAGAAREVQITCRNPSLTSRLTIRSVETSCGCSEIERGSFRLDPGESKTLSMVWTMPDQPGPTSVEVRLHCDSGATISERISAEITRPLPTTTQWSERGIVLPLDWTYCGLVEAVDCYADGDAMPVPSLFEAAANRFWAEPPPGARRLEVVLKGPSLPEGRMLSVVSLSPASGTENSFRPID